jgi:hypothetical protein
VTKLWVDDLRQPPDDGWALARTSAEAIERLVAADYDELSLDHDLEGDDTTRPVVLWLCDHPDRWPTEVRVHTADPAGREWLLGMIGRHHTS